MELVLEALFDRIDRRQMAAVGDHYDGKQGHAGPGIMQEVVVW